jgi:glucokinase
MDLLADIGGTNARIAFREPGAVPDRVYLRRTADYPSLETLLLDVMREAGAAPRRAALAVAGPVTGDVVSLTNLPWTFSALALRRDLNVVEMLIENDVAAMAWAIPGATGAELDALTPELSGVHGPKLIVAPGTGLGMAALVPTRRGRWVAVASEGGHAYAGPSPAIDRATRAAIWADDAMHTWEGLVSGVGLPRLFRQLGGAADTPPEQITARATAGDARALATMDAFARLLGAFAGDAAMILGARGGCYLAGGLIGSMGALFKPAPFVEGFRAKERFTGYVSTIPLYVVKLGFPALAGLGALLDALD